MAGGNLTMDGQTGGRSFKTFRPGIVVSATEPPCKEDTLWYDTSASSAIGVLECITVTEDTTLLQTYELVLVDAISSSITITLPLAATSKKLYYIKKIDSTANTVTIEGAQTIDGGLNAVLTNKDEVIGIASDLTEWRILMAYNSIPIKIEEGERRAVVSDTSTRDVMNELRIELKKMNAHFAVITDEEISEDDILEG